MKTRSILSKTAAAAALVLAVSIPAHAEVLVLESPSFSYSGTPQQFVWERTFNVSADNPQVTATLTDTAAPAPFFLLNLLVTQLGGTSMGQTRQEFNTASNITSFSFSATPGAYKATLFAIPGISFTLPLPTGTLLFGGGTAGVQIAAVPEPEVWAMMLVGAGLVGYQLRRKARAASAAAIG